jgi:6-pyruvoyltetrahydropterin/6-carboxytetrahydropterin synthase
MTGGVRLMREIRFSIDRDWVQAAHGRNGFARAHPVSNSWGGWPSAVGIAPYLVQRVTVSGRPHPATGYLVNIRELDGLLRREAIPLAAQRLSAEGVQVTGENLVRDVWAAINTPGAMEQDIEGSNRPEAAAEFEVRSTGRYVIEELELWTTPYLSYAISVGAFPMVEVTQSFEFSASHRLHVTGLSEEENRRIFGKCDNPNGHGHNYRLEVTVAGAAAGPAGQVIALPQLEEVVKREVIDRYDHRHLNTDTEEFATVNPSVENIARTIWGLLEGKFGPARLRRVRVWETAKTYAEYEGE